MNPEYCCPVCGWRFCPYFDWDGDVPEHNGTPVEVGAVCPGSGQAARPVVVE